MKGITQSWGLPTNTVKLREMHPSNDMYAADTARSSALVIHFCSSLRQEGVFCLVPHSLKEGHDARATGASLL